MRIIDINGVPVDMDDVLLPMQQRKAEFISKYGEEKYNKIISDPEPYVRYFFEKSNIERAKKYLGIAIEALSVLC